MKNPALAATLERIAMEGKSGFYRGVPAEAISDFEDRIPADVLSVLSGRGHEPRTIHGWTATFGGAQMIRVEPWGTLTVAADPRREAYGMAY